MPAFGSIPSNLARVDANAVYYSTYSPKDFERWDSYEARFSVYSPPIAVRDSFTQAYLTAVRSVFSSQYLGVMNGYFIDYLRSPSNPNTTLNGDLQTGNLNTTNVYLFGSMAINTAYNTYRQQQLDSGMTQSQFDNLVIDWLSLPTVADTAAVIESWINLYFSIQFMSHGSFTDARGTYDKFGFFPSFANPTVAISGLLFFQLSGIAGVCCHYAHLLTSATLRNIRVRMMAAMTALYNYILITGQNNQASTAQWITRHASFATATTFIIQAEARLRERGDWLSSDNVISTDRNNGLWTQTDALHYATYLSSSFISYTKQYGFEEYNSAYYAFDLQQISMTIIHAPSQAMYNYWNEFYQMLWMDMSLNFLPVSACLSAPASRTSRMLHGTFTTMDRHDIPIFVQPLFTPSLSAYMGSIHPNSQTCVTSDIFAIDPYRFIFTTKQLGNLDFFLPHKLLKQYCTDMPYHIQKSRFSSTIGQERYNLITPYYTMGCSGEDSLFTGANVKFCVRLGGGMKTAQTLLTNSNVPFVQLISNTNSNDTFSNKTGIIVENDQYTPRQITTQYQGYALITQLHDSSYVDSTGSQGLSVDLLVPLNINGGIWINNTAMSLTAPTSMTVPANFVLTVRHNGSSAACRLLYSQHNVRPAASNLAPYSDMRVTNLSNNKPSPQPFHIMYQVDTQSFNYSCARLIVTMKNPNNLLSTKNPYRLAWLIAAGETSTDAERVSLQNVVGSAVYKQQFSEVWPIRDQPYYDFVKYQKHWSCQITIANTLTLAVQRTDIRSVNNNDLLYRDGNRTLNLNPYFFSGFNRLVNGVDINSVSGNSGFLHSNIAFTDMFEPHRGKNTVVSSNFVDSLTALI